ncbi:MAG: c-type cytochrome [Planctomycetota bacterium]|nr:c-type cytochrome [Planctomycetota bacterium]
MTAQENTETTPEKDPITEGSILWPVFIAMVVLLFVSVWSLYDEFYTRRPYKKYQSDWTSIARAAYKSKVADAQANLDELKATEGYKALLNDWNTKRDAAGAPYQELQDKLSKEIAPRLAVLGEPVKEARSQVSALTYRIERSREHENENEERYYLAELDKVTRETYPLEFPGGEAVEWDYDQMLAEFNRLKEYQGVIQGRMALVKTAESDARNALNAFVDTYMVGPKPDSIAKLITSVDEFEHEIKQIHIQYADGELIERCESCHLGTRSPVALTMDDVAGRKEFVSHPNPDLLKTHDPEVMGCSPCHGGNGIATQSITLAHGRYKYWLWPLLYKENTEGGCVQCHQSDQYLAGADTLNHGRHLFTWRGCVGCHRHEQFIADEDEGKALENRVTATAKAIQDTQIEIARLTALTGVSDDEDQIVAAFAEREKENQNLYLLQTEKVALADEVRGLEMEQKRIGPNLKELSAKIRPGWLHGWLMDPRAFRPSTKMPRFRLDSDQAWAIAAFLWQNSAPVSFDTEVAEGDATRGEWLVSTRGCLGCHKTSTEEYDDIGGTFAADLSRVGEKASYAYLASWVKNPRHHNAHTVMPSLRLSDQDAKDIATFLKASARADVAYDDAASRAILQREDLRATGQKLVKHLGCAGCHEIKGLENEDRVGTELTKEGSKPLERLDFGTLTHAYYRKGEYKHKWFFEDKLYDPAIWDKDKYKPNYFDKLKMPGFFPEVPERDVIKAHLEKLDPDADEYDSEKAALDAQMQVHDDVSALTTFMLGSVDARLPPSLKYTPEGLQKDLQDGWWVVKKYNCEGCHQILPGATPELWSLDIYQDGTGFEGVPDKNGRPPTLIGQGTRTDPDWLMRFLEDPSLSHTGEALTRNGVRQGLAVRMPTFFLSERERGKLTRFFTAMANLTRNYQRPATPPLEGDMLDLGRAAFTAGDCANCHLLGGETNVNPATTYAPSFQPVAQRIKPDWVHRWVTEPQSVIPGTAMPALLKRQPVPDGVDRWILSVDDISETAKKRVGAQMLENLRNYQGDHADLLKRYFANWNETEAKYQADKRKIN